MACFVAFLSLFEFRRGLLFLFLCTKVAYFFPLVSPHAQKCGLLWAHSTNPHNNTSISGLLWAHNSTILKYQREQHHKPSSSPSYYIVKQTWRTFSNSVLPTRTMRRCRRCRPAARPLLTTGTGHLFLFLQQRNFKSTSTLTLPLLVRLHRPQQVRLHAPMLAASIHSWMTTAMLGNTMLTFQPFQVQRQTTAAALSTKPLTT